MRADFDVATLILISFAVGAVCSIVVAWFTYRALLRAMQREFDRLEKIWRG